MEQADFMIDTFTLGEQWLATLSGHSDAVILDYFLDGIDRNAMNGIETFDQIKTFDFEIPVISLSEQDKIEVTINCMHHKTSD